MWCMLPIRQRLLTRLHNPQYLTSTGVVAVAYKVLLPPADFRDCIHSTGAYSPCVKSFGLARFGQIAVLLAFEPITGSPRTAGGILTRAFCLDTILKTECVPWYAVMCSYQNALQERLTAIWHFTHSHDLGKNYGSKRRATVVQRLHLKPFVLAYPLAQWLGSRNERLR